MSLPAATSVTFLVEEYKNIAATHDKLRDMLARLFNYFLLLSAFPFTVAGVMFQQGGFDLMAAPLGLHLLFLVVGVGHLFLTLSLVDARLSQYRYAKTVNAIRKYFVDNDGHLSGYVFLPTSTDVPSWEDLGYIEYQVWFMTWVGAIFTGYGLLGIETFASRPCSAAASLVGVVCYAAAYKTFRTLILRRFQRHRGIK